MSSKTKIVVLHMKEVVYTSIFLCLALLVLVLMFFMFGRKKDSTAIGADTEKDARFVPGVYNSTIKLNDNSFDVQVTVDANHINAIELVNLSEAATAMYPLMTPTLEQLAAQIYTTQSLENISYGEDNKYTSMLLLESIKNALEKAKPEN